MFLYLIIGIIIGAIAMIPFVIQKQHKENEYIKQQEEKNEQLKVLYNQYQVKLEDLQVLYNQYQVKLEDLQDEYSRYNQTFDELTAKLNNLNLDYAAKTTAVSNLKEEYYNIEKDVENLKGKKEELQDAIETGQELAKKSVKVVYDIAYQNMAEAVEREAEKASVALEKNRKEYEEEYLNVLNDFTKDFNEITLQEQEKLQQVKEELNKTRAAAEAARLAFEREDEKRNAENKYRLSITEKDLIEIKRLKEVIPFISNPRPISKIIWEGYFRQATNDLINRLITVKPSSGIYRITNLLDGRSYIGQSVDIAERWKQHIKCGLGIDAPNNILYKAMQKDGVENFTFEVLQLCGKDELNNQEVFWIDYYKTQKYGYNMSKGGS